MNMYAIPSESYPMSFETMKTLSQLAKDVQAATGRTLKSKSILRMADSHSVTTGDIENLYRMESRLTGVNDAAAAAIYAVRMDLAQPFSNDFYKNPNTGFGYTEEEA